MAVHVGSGARSQRGQHLQQRPAMLARTRERVRFLRLLRAYLSQLGCVAMVIWRIAFLDPLLDLTHPTRIVDLI